MKQSLPEPATVYGLILCGGKSTRMGTDKAFLAYHRQPQYIYLSELFNEMSIQPMISCNTDQDKFSFINNSVIADNPLFAHAGPMTGLLSAFEKHQQCAFFVVGCDYPYLNKNALLSLIAKRDRNHDVVCFHDADTGFDEPILAIYEPSCFTDLKKFYEAGNTSLSRFLKTKRTKRVLTSDRKYLYSIDNPEDYNKIISSEN